MRSAVVEHRSPEKGACLGDNLKSYPLFLSPQKVAFIREIFYPWSMQNRFYHCVALVSPFGLGCGAISSQEAPSGLLSSSSTNQPSTVESTVTGNVIAPDQGNGPFPTGLYVGLAVYVPNSATPAGAVCPGATLATVDVVENNGFYQVDNYATQLLGKTLSWKAFEDQSSISFTLSSDGSYTMASTTAAASSSDTDTSCSYSGKLLPPTTDTNGTVAAATYNGALAFVTGSNTTNPSGTTCGGSITEKLVVTATGGSYKVNGYAASSTSGVLAWNEGPTAATAGTTTTTQLTQGMLTSSGACFILQAQKIQTGSGKTSTTNYTNCAFSGMLSSK